MAEIRLDCVNTALLRLQSIIAIPDETLQPIRLHNASFRAYIMDPRRCNDERFSVDGKRQHKILAERCLRIMAEHLRKNVCEARAPGTRMTQIDRKLI